MEKIHLIIRKLRKEKNLSQRQMAEKIGVSVSTFSGYETGYSKPSFDNIVHIAEIFNVSTDLLLGKQSPVNQKRILEEPQEKYGKSQEVICTGSCLSCQDKEKMIQGLEARLTDKDKQLEDLKSNFEQIVAGRDKQNEALERQNEDLKINLERVIASKDEMLTLYKEQLEELKAKLEEPKSKAVSENMRQSA